MHDPLHIETNRPTVASVLKQAGYATAAIGKWHLGYSDRSVNFTERLAPGPLEIGFDYHFGIASNHGDGSGVFLENHRVWGLRSKTVQPFGVQFYGDRPFMGLDAPQRVDEDVPIELLARVTSWLDKQPSPFFLYYAPVEPHVPVTPSRAVAGTSKAGPYGDWVHELDRNIGRLMDYLDERSLAEDTLLIVTSDNGGEHKPTRKMESVRAIEAGLAINGPWRAGKHTIYEGGFRVPLIARWPGRIQAGTTVDDALNLVDLPATLAAVANQPAPAPGSGFEDSVNRLPELLGTSHEPRTCQVLQSADGVLAVRDERWKWIEGKPTNPDAPKNRSDEFRSQLYDLQSDPGETRDVISLHADMAARLAGWLDQTRAIGQSRGLPVPP
jgi:arylsulfatase A-like enzyme